MKKRSFSKACNFRCHTKTLLKEKRMYKKLRHKRARQSKNPELIYKKTDSWNII